MKITRPERAAGGAAAPAKRRRRSAAEWAATVAEWKRSGKTAREFAGPRGLEAATLLWWSSQGPRRAGAIAASSARARTSTAGAQATLGAAAFLPLRVTGPAAEVAPAGSPRHLAADVVLVNGRRVQLRGELTLAELLQLLDALEGGATC